MPPPQEEKRVEPQPAPQPAPQPEPQPEPAKEPSYTPPPTPNPAPEPESQPPTGKKERPESIFHIEVDKIRPNPYQPRRTFDETGLRELAQSIREFGIIQPLVVSKNEKESETGTSIEYQLIAGERRLRASKLVGLERVPAIVKQPTAPKANLELALIENVQRSDLSPLEAAKAYSRLQDEFNLTQREIATRVGKSREAVANTLRLLNLPSHMQVALVDAKINESQARVLLAIDNLDSQERTFQQLLNQKISVRALRHNVKQQKESTDPQHRYWEKQLEEKLGAPVKLTKLTDGKGKMVVQFTSNEEWRGIVDRLLGEEE
jgi:ParB family chromosome partitioning protein